MAGLQGDPQKLEGHRDRRAKWVQRKKQSKSWLASRCRAGVKRTTLKTKRTKGVELIAPDDFFYKIEDYEAKFGALASGKKRGLAE